MVQLIGMLLTVVAILFLSWYLTRKLGMAAGYRTSGSVNLKVMDRVPLGQNEALAVVRAGRSFLLLGITPAGITCLKELSGDEVEENKSFQDPSSQTPVDFHSLLEQLKKRNWKDGK